ncbi:MAG: hypothetical protein RDU20_21685 [Desulfomonilaceae bacterium]|nr:hypothetical protein [Desulfomonilaceae bacterium]
MRTYIRKFFGIVPVLALLSAGWAGTGYALPNSDWVAPAGSSDRISHGEEGTNAGDRIVPRNALERGRMGEAATHVLSAEFVTASDRGEERQQFKRSDPQTRERHRRPYRQPTQWVSQRFRTNVMGARVRGTVERMGDAVRGVVYVLPPFGGKNTYHFQGRIQGNRVMASHHSGHVFHGEIVGGSRVVGVVTTRQGRRIPLDLPVGFP